ncbi:hypothetical protein L3X38_001666 [Prunus dulcis]|uniref:Uncharacterized protein n=1 Tax=Prunus dulcis TaxID=3755 RepID=A0AAD4WSJ8_PRUDU|nr:hypothetical protein L3X38_001666 [Prunus dulcis]
MLRGNGSEVFGQSIGIVSFCPAHGREGLWMGITVAQALSLSFICIDWEKEVKKALDRVYDAMAVADASS